MIQHLLLGALLLGGPVQSFPETDTTFAAGNATRFSIESIGGAVVIEAWDRDEIRITAEHSRRTEIEIRRSGRAIYVEGEGRAAIVDYHISLPKNMDVEVEGYQTSIRIDGMAGEIDAETFAGNVDITGGRGAVTAETVGGNITIEGSEAEINASSVGGRVSVKRSSGEMRLESIGGPIVLEDVSSSDLEAETVGGSITYRGALAETGTYFFGSHVGTITLELDPDTHADLTVAMITGSLDMDFPNSQGRVERHTRSRLSLGGGGGANLEIETFSGSIRIRSRR